MLLYGKRAFNWELHRIMVKQVKVRENKQRNITILTQI